MILFPFLSHAQREGNEIKGVIVDSFEIKSTICPDGKRIENINEKDTTHWYQNWKVYSIKPSETKSEGNRTSSTLETIIITPGGAFVDRDEAFLNPLNPNNQNINLNIAASLAQQGYNVILAKYDVADLVETLSIADIFNDCNLNSTVPRSVLLKQSYESFFDFRRLLKNMVNGTNFTPIDPSKTLLIGFSAGAILSNYYLFLDSAEIPTKTGNSQTVIENVRRLHYPVPTFRGVMTFAGATLIDNIFDAGDFSWINSNNIKLYMLHGTCDEVVPFNVGRVTPKCPFINPTNYTTGDNFPIAYGSRYLYNKLKNSIPIRFEEVCRGGHQPLPKSADASNVIGAWDFYDVSNSLDSRNPTDPVEDRIVQFAEYLFNNVGTFSTGFYGFTPERITSRCFTDTTDVIQIQSIADSGSTCSTTPTKIKITAGGQNAMIYQWKVGRANWFTTDVPFLNLSDIPGYFLLSDVLTGITGKQTIEVDIEIRAINGCNTKTYTTRRTFNYFTPPSQCSSGSRFSNTNENLNDGLASRIDDYTKYTYIENKNLENEELEIVITDINGSVLSRKNIFVDGNNILALSPKETKIDILPIGVYFLQIKSKNQASNVIKFIIR